MQYERGKIIPFKKRLFTPKWRLNPFLKHNGSYVTVVSLSGFIGRDDIEKIGNIIEKDLTLGINRFIVSFSDVNHIHYKDVNLLLSLKEKIDKCKAELKFVVKKPYIIDILYVGGWPFIHKFYPTERSAINAFREEHPLNWRKNVDNTYAGSIKGND